VEGIEPISPAVTRGIHGSAFTQIGDTAPELSWKPPSMPGVTYDLAIWEAAAYRLPSAMFDNHLPGHLAVYEENVAEPHLRLQAPLKPKTKYYWSIRMRSGDVVSSWSRAGHVAFMVVALTSSRVCIRDALRSIEPAARSRAADDTLGLIRVRDGDRNDFSQLVRGHRHSRHQRV
jgi:hypothetical protein